jgi:alanine racemase
MNSRNNIPFKSWVEISKDNLLHNLRVFKRIIGGKNVGCVIKANAYGHGLVEIANILKNKKNIWLVVDNYKEAIKIRESKIKKPILILGYTPFHFLKDAAKNNISLVISSIETLEDILKQKIEIGVHLKLETGMNRRGLPEKEFIEAIKLINKNTKYLKLEGVLTHLADSENIKNISFSLKQINKFKNMINYLKKNKIEIPYIHFAKTSSSLLFSEKNFNLVRVGIGLYGLWPSDEIKKKFPKVDLKRVLEWKTIIAEINKVKKGESVGYGRTWRAERDSQIVVIPVGYYDGFDRSLGNKGRVLIKGQYCRIVGRVTMNMIMADATSLKDLKLEDEVVIIGKQGNNEITAEEIAEKTGTINYEVVTRINPLIPRIIVK